MAGLDPAAARTAAADLELVAGHQRRGGRQVLDVLHRHPLQRQLTAAVGTARRQPHRNDLVDLLGDGPVGVATVGRTRLAARAPGMRRGVALGERSGLAFRRPTQRLDLAAQPLVDLLEPLTLGPQPLVLRPQPFPLLPQLPLLFAQRGVLVLKPNDAPAQPARASRIPTSLRTSRLPRHKAGRLQPSHPASRTGTRYLNTAKQGFRWVTPGGILAVVVWVVASVAFAIYVANF